MTKWPGYSEDEGRTRFQRRIPPDVRHPFNNSERLRSPLKLPKGPEAQCRALAWCVVYEEEFARIRDPILLEEVAGDLWNNETLRSMPPAEA